MYKSTSAVNNAKKINMRSTYFYASLIAILPSVAQAEVELGFYGGLQSAPHSRVIFSGDGVIPDEDYLVGWEGRSLEAPIYYGLRATYWGSDTVGFGVDFTHAKIYPKEGDLPAGFDALEFTDGLNILTANVYRRWPGALWDGALTPYVGAGLGVSIPHVEVEYESSKTNGYQFTGPAAALVAGAQYDLSDRWGVFAEYKFSYSQNTGDLDGGGTIRTDNATNALNIGVSYTF